MKKYTIALFFILGLSACKKNNEIPSPEAGFNFGDAKESSITVKVGTTIVPVNNSSNAVSYLWDLGNGTTSTEKTPVLSFDKGGDFKISLTVKNKDGVVSTVQKQVKVLSPQVNQIKITDLAKWTPFPFSDLTKFAGGTVWVEVYKSKNTLLTYDRILNRDFEFPDYFKSNVVNVPADATYPVVIDVPGKLALDDKVSKKYSFVFALYVKDASGTHLLFTSDFVGSTTVLTDFSGGFEWSSTVNNTKLSLDGVYQ